MTKWWCSDDNPALKLSFPSIRLFPLHHALLALLLWGAAALPALGAPVEVTILTVNDELFPPALPGESAPSRTPVNFQTPAELSRFSDGETIRFESAYPTLPFNEIKALLFQEESRKWFRSEAPAIEWYRLGSVDAPAPPLPGWSRAYGEHASWRPTVPAAVTGSSPYVNRAQAVWVTDDPLLPQSNGEFLFRSRIVTEAGGRISNARLHLAVQGQLLEVRLNDHRVLTAPPSGPAPRIYDVSRLLRPGANILAFRIRNPGPPFAMNPSLAFSLEYGVTNHASRSLSPAYRQALLTTRHGDRVWGRLLTFNPVSVLFQTPYGRYGADWDDIESVIFPQGWYDPAEEKPPVIRRLTRFFGFAELAREAEIPDALPLGVPLSSPVSGDAEGVLLRDGRFLSDDLDAMHGDKVTLRKEDSQQRVSVSRSDIAAIYPPPPERTRLERPSRDFAALDCRLKTREGEIFSGILRQIQSQRIVLEHTGDGILSFAPSDVVWIWFPMHPDGDGRETMPAASVGARSGEKKGTRVAILAIDSSKAPLSQETRDLHVEIQKAAFLAGRDCEFPTPEAIADPERLHIRNYPLVAIANENGGFPDTIQEEGDARAAIVKYVESGGTLLVYAQRGALNSPRRWVRSENDAEELEAPGLLESLALSFASEEGVRGGSERAFVHPPNVPETLSMERSSIMPAGLRNLPPRIDVPDRREAPFYPLRVGKGDGDVLYRLVSETRAEFGPSLVMVPRGRGWVVVVDHFLWHASIEGREFTHMILPRLVNWAFERHP